MAEEKKKRKRKKPKGHHPGLSYPQFATHVYGGGWWAPGYASNWTAQSDGQAAEGGGDAGGGEGGGTL